MRVDGAAPIGDAHAMRMLIPLLAATILSTAPAPAQTPALTGLDAWKAIVGNTLVGKTESGEAQVEYFAPDGAARHRISGKAGEGAWSLRGDKVCTNYADDDDDEDDVDPLARVGRNVKVS